MKVTKTDRKGGGARKEIKLPLSLLPSYFLCQFDILNLCFLFTSCVLGKETTAKEAMKKWGLCKTSKQ